MVMVQTKLFKTVDGKLICNEWIGRRVIGFDGNWVRGLR